MHGWKDAIREDHQKGFLGKFVKIIVETPMDCDSSIRGCFLSLQFFNHAKNEP